MKTMTMLMVLLGFRIHYKDNEVRLQKTAKGSKCRSIAEIAAPTQPPSLPCPRTTKVKY